MDKAIRVLQNSSRPGVLPAGLENKWWAARHTGAKEPYDIEVDEDEDGRPIYGTVMSPVSEYIGPNGWQPTAHYFDSSEECVAALAAVGITDVELWPYSRPTPEEA